MQKEIASVEITSKYCPVGQCTVLYRTVDIVVKTTIEDESLLKPVEIRNFHTLKREAGRQYYSGITYHDEYEWRRGLDLDLS